MNRHQIASTLAAMADLLEVASGNPFRARSFRAAARALEDLGEDLELLLAEGRLVGLPGIGEAIAREVEDLHRQGESQRLKELLAAVPPGVRKMLDLPGLGPKKVRALWKQLGVEDLEALAAACDAGRVARLSGFGAKSQARIRQGVDFLSGAAGRFLVPEAEAWAEELAARLRKHEDVERVDVAGALRRRAELVERIDLLVVASCPEKFLGDLPTRLDRVDVRLEEPARLAVARLPGGIEARIHVASGDEWVAALVYATGSEPHLSSLRELAESKGFELNEQGLWKASSSGALPLSSEEELYAALDRPLIPPEWREGRGEIERAEELRGLRLVEEKDLKGLIHVHTTYSDGRLGLEQLVEAARARGFSYLGLADHSQSAYYAGGLREGDIIRQHREIDHLNEKLEGFRIFKGIESDIRPDGALDYSPQVLDRFDFVIASVHSSMGQPRREMTHRVIRALSDPHATFLGHPSGRLLLQRPELTIDLEAVLRAAAAEGVGVEINANPRRLDLDWRHGPLAQELGIEVGIHPDAHSAAGIDDLRFGVGVARKAGVDVSRVVNARSAEGFAEFIARRRGGLGR